VSGTRRSDSDEFEEVSDVIRHVDAAVEHPLRLQAVSESDEDDATCASPVTPSSLGTPCTGD
jgi:hypothetical protein